MNPRLVSISKNINELAVVQPEVFYDARGENIETFDASEYKQLFRSAPIKEFNEGLEFIVDSLSFSRRNVLRGFHGDTCTWKLVQCLQGEIQLGVIDLRKDSPSYMDQETFYVNDKNRLQVLIPKGCINAHLVLSESCLFSYKLTHKYVPQSEQITLKWNDPVSQINWATSKPILSQRDS